MGATISVILKQEAVLYRFLKRLPGLGEAANSGSFGDFAFIFHHSIAESHTIPE
jgi:hypothetical protein